MKKSWWVILFILACYMFYEQQQRQRVFEYNRLAETMKDLESKRTEALARREDLLLQINSQSDPDWVELTLIKGLGLVPEGYKKVYFPSLEP